jgi:hypothetical protein
MALRQFGQTSVGQTLDTWQPGSLETLEDHKRALEELQRTLANNDRLMQTFFEKFQNPFQGSEVGVSSTGVLSFGFSKVILQSGVLEVGKRQTSQVANKQFAGSFVEISAESGVADDLTDITIAGWEDFPAGAEKGRRSVPLLFIVPASGHAITVKTTALLYNSVTTGGEIVLDDPWNCLMCALIRNNWVLLLVEQWF